MSLKNIDKIVDLVVKETEISKFVDKKRISENNYALHPSHYLQKEQEVKDGVSFASVIEKIIRGAQIKAEELGKFISEKDTDWH